MWGQFALLLHISLVVGQKVRPEDEAALAELKHVEAQRLAEEKQKANKMYQIDFGNFEADEVLLPPGLDNDGYHHEPKFRRNPQNQYADVGPYEYNRMLQSIFWNAEHGFTSVDPQILYSSLMSEAGSTTTTGTDSSTTTDTFSYSFPPDTAASSFPFSTTASQPQATNTIIEDSTRPESWHYKNASTYQIGALIPMSANGSGLLSGVQLAESFKCAINLINSNSRVLRNNLLTYLIQDTEVLPSVATNQAFLLDRRGLSMVIGPYEYDALPPIANLYNNVSLPFISYGASGVQYSNGTQYPSFFRTIPSDVNTARAMAETMKLFGWNYVAAIFSSDSYGQSGRTALLQQIGRQRLKVTCVNQIDPGSVRGLPNFADCVARSDAECGSPLDGRN